MHGARLGQAETNRQQHKVVMHRAQRSRCGGGKPQSVESMVRYVRLLR